MYPGQTVTARSIAYGRALTNSEIDAETIFFIQAQDQFTNKQTGCVDFFDVEVRGGPLTVEPGVMCDSNGNRVTALSQEEPTDLGDGHYSVMYIALEVQTYAVWIMRDGGHISG